jgi:hypothetical protein
MISIAKDGGFWNQKREFRADYATKLANQVFGLKLKCEPILDLYNNIQL